MLLLVDICDVVPWLGRCNKPLIASELDRVCVCSHAIDSHSEVFVELARDLLQVNHLKGLIGGQTGRERRQCSLIEPMQVVEAQIL